MKGQQVAPVPNPQTNRTITTQQERSKQMKKFGLATIVTSGLAAALLGLAAPAQAVVPGGGARVLDSVYGAMTALAEFPH